MSEQSLEAMERDIAETRARLDDTLDRISDRMSVSGIVDDMLGTVRRSPFSDNMDRTLVAVRENPLPVLVAALGIGWLIYRMVENERTLHRRVSRPPAPTANPSGVYPAPRPYPDMTRDRATIPTAETEET